jgi:hypothetical protein
MVWLEVDDPMNKNAWNDDGSKGPANVRNARTSSGPNLRPARRDHPAMHAVRSDLDQLQRVFPVINSL